jgi:hypothetical protein
MIITMCLFLASCFGASDPVVHPGIVTTGSGSTFEQAKHDAVNRAIEYRSGTLILGDKKLTNFNLVKNEIFAYNSGYIENFKILSHNQTQNGHQVRAEVWVSDSKLASRILPSKTPNITVNGHVIALSQNSFLERQHKADLLVRKALETYPNKAYDISVTETKLYIDQNRNSQIDLKFSVKLNKNFLAVLTETLGNVHDKNVRPADASASMLVEYKPEGKIFNFGTLHAYYFRDVETVKNIGSLLYNHQAVVKINFQTQSGNIERCFPLPRGFFYGKDISTLDIRGEAVYNSLIKVTTNPEFVSKLTNVELTVESSNRCYG